MRKSFFCAIISCALLCGAASSTPAIADTTGKIERYAWRVVPADQPWQLPNLWVDLDAVVNVTSIYDQHCTLDSVTNHKFDPQGNFTYWGSGDGPFIADGLQETRHPFVIDICGCYRNTTYQNIATLTASYLENDPNATQLATKTSEYVPQ